MDHNSEARYLRFDVSQGLLVMLHQSLITTTALIYL